MRSADGGAKKGAVKFTRRLKAGGNTNLYAGLAAAFEDKDVDTIYLLTDGMPSSGEIIDTDLITENVLHWNKRRRIVINAVSLSKECVFLEDLARRTGGQYMEAF